MTSTTLLNKQFLNVLKNQIKQLKVWMIVVPLLITAVTAGLINLCSENVYFINSYSEVQDSTYQDTKNAFTDKTVSNVMEGATYFSAAVLAIFSIVVYSHLYSKRRSDLFESLPLTKKQIMASRTVSVGIMLVTTYVLQMLITYIMIHSDAFNTAKCISADYYAKVYLIELFCSFAFYCISQFAAISAGRGWQYWIFIFGTYFAIPYAINTVLLMPSYFESGASSILTDFAGLCSPTIAPLLVVTHDIRFRYILLSMLAIIIITLFLTMLVYGKRKSECAEQSVSGYMAVGITAFGIQVSAFNLVCLFSLKVSQYFIAILITTVIGLILVAVFSAIIYHKVFTKPLAIQFTIVAVAIGVYIAILVGGGFGFSSYQPKTSEISQAKVYIDGWNDVSLYEKAINFYSYDEVTDGKIVKSAEAIEAVKEIQNNGIKKFKDNAIIKNTYKIKIVYYLNNGKKVYRYYPHELSYIPKLYNTKEYKQSNDIIKAGKNNVIKMSYSNYNGENINLDVNEFYDAVVDDYMAMDENDFRKTSMNDMIGLSKITINYFIINDGATDKERKKFMSMTEEELNNYINVTDVSKSLVTSSCIDVTSDAKNTYNLLVKNNFSTKFTELKDVNADNIAYVQCATLQYDKNEGQYFVGPKNMYYTVDTAESVLGTKVLEKGFEDNYHYVFEKIEGKDNINDIFASIDSNSDQNKLLLQSGNSGYIVYFVMKDDSRSRTFFVSDVEAYNAGNLDK